MANEYDFAVYANNDGRRAYTNAWLYDRDNPPFEVKQREDGSKYTAPCGYFDKAPEFMKVGSDYLEFQRVKRRALNPDASSCAQRREKLKELGSLADCDGCSMIICAHCVHKCLDGQEHAP